MPQIQHTLCICRSECDCMNPPPDDWDGKDGVYHVSNHCPVHNDYPHPDPACEAEMHHHARPTPHTAWAPTLHPTTYQG